VVSQSSSLCFCHYSHGIRPGSSGGSSRGGRREPVPVPGVPTAGPGASDVHPTAGDDAEPAGHPEPGRRHLTLLHLGGSGGGSSGGGSGLPSRHVPAVLLPQPARLTDQRGLLPATFTGPTHARDTVQRRSP